MNSCAGKVSVRKEINRVIYSTYAISKLTKSKRDVIESKLFYNTDLPYNTVHWHLYHELKTGN